MIWVPQKRLLSLCAAALILAACGGGTSEAPDGSGVAASSGEAAAAPGEGAAATAEAVTEAETEAASAESAELPFDPDGARLERLIFWDSQIFLAPSDVPASLLELIDSLLASDDPAANPYLADLAALPNPYRDVVFDALRERLGKPLAFSVHEFPEMFPATLPSEDTEAYLFFKQRIFATLQARFGDFLHPLKPRTISAREVVWGGVAVDGIPPLEFPRFVTPQEADDWINPRDEIVGVEINGDARAYPIRIIAWHEMVNDTIGGVPVSLAYCTLCGSAILYDGRIGAELYRFGTSGLLYRSNKLMYDRTTGTLWDQFTGKPAWGTLVGGELRLTTLPSVYTTWGEWLVAHPDTTVLDIDTGFSRDYSPGAAYADYNASAATIFAVPEQDDRLRVKDEVYVVRVGDELTAYPTAILAERELIHDTVGGQDVVVIATQDGKGGRSYDSGGLTFREVNYSDGTVIGDDGRVWRISEEALISDAGERLIRISGHNAFWFAIVNHTPNGRLYEEFPAN